MRSKLAKLNLIGNKHIPAVYLRSDTEQRLELLRGIMDSDGSIGKNGRCEITLKSKKLIDDIFELLSGLGIKHTVKEKMLFVPTRLLKHTLKSGVYLSLFTMMYQFSN